MTPNDLSVLIFLPVALALLVWLIIEGRRMRREELDYRRHRDQQLAILDRMMEECDPTKEVKL